MRYLRYASVAVFAAALIMLAMANRNMVNLRVWPGELAGMAAFDPSFEVPLFVVILGSILVGLIIGLIWEWIREAGDRAAAARQARELSNMQTELRRLKKDKNEGIDEVLVILEEAS